MSSNAQEVRQAAIRELARRELERRQGRTQDTPVQSFNRGITDLLSAPNDLMIGGANLIKAGANAVGLPGGERLRGAAGDFTPLAQQAGLVADQPGDGLIARTAEIAGSSTIPVGGMLRAGQSGLAAGQQAAREGLRQLGYRSAPQGIMAQAAQSPIRTVAGEAVASLTAATGGETARQFTDDPTIIALSEMAGGFAPVGVSVASSVSPVRRVADAVATQVAPFTRRGAMPGAAREIQTGIVDTDAAAQAVATGDSRLSPARRTGNQQALALERAVLDDNPKLDAIYGDDLVVAIEGARQDALAFGGDTSRPRQILREGRDYLVNLVRLQASQAARQAEDAIERLRPDATPREISAVARAQLEGAERAARTQERTIWRMLDQGASAQTSNADETLRAIESSRTRAANPEDIPQYVRDLLNPSGEIRPPETIGYVQDLRSRILSDIAEEKAKPGGGNRNKLRILNSIANGNPDEGWRGLIDDLGAAEAEGIESAIAFSRELNDKYTRGNVGRLLGFDATGAQRVSGEDTLRRLLGTPDAGTDLAQFVRASPEAAEQARDFIRAQYFEDISAGGFNQQAHDAFLRKYNRSGVLDSLPGLREELVELRDVQSAATRLGARAERVAQASRNASRSRAALYLEAPLDQEMSALLRSRNPEAAARKLVAEMGGDRVAIQGLKEQFIEELLNNSTTSRSVGTNVDETADIVSGNSFQRLLNENRRVLRALGMNDQEMARMNRTAAIYRRVERQPARTRREIVANETLLETSARILGARLGGAAGRESAGGSLQTAQIFSKRFANWMRNLSKKRQLIIDAHNDGELYQALMTRSTDGPAKKERAIRALNAWAISVGMPEIEETE